MNSLIAVGSSEDHSNQKYNDSSLPKMKLSEIKQRLSHKIEFVEGNKTEEIST